MLEPQSQNSETFDRTLRDIWPHKDTRVHPLPTVDSRVQDMVNAIQDAEGAQDRPRTRGFLTWRGKMVSEPQSRP